MSKSCLPPYSCTRAPITIHSRNKIINQVLVNVPLITAALVCFFGLFFGLAH